MPPKRATKKRKRSAIADEEEKIEKPIENKVQEEQNENQSKKKQKTSQSQDIQSQDIQSQEEIQESKEQSRERLIAELEWIQCLANPSYLSWLGAQRYFHLPGFINYLKYLQYWKKPEYARLLAYPQCLAFLDLLQKEAFRDAILNTNIADMLHQQQFYHWQYYRTNRFKAKKEQEEIKDNNNKN